MNEPFVIALLLLLAAPGLVLPVMVVLGAVAGIARAFFAALKFAGIKPRAAKQGSTR